MSSVFNKLVVVSMATAMLIAHQSDAVLAHPGHGPPDRPGFSRDGGTTSSGPQRNGSDRDRRMTKTERLATDAEVLVKKSTLLQRRIATVDARVAKSAQAFQSTGELKDSARKQVLRSVRSARRATEQLISELGLFLKEYSTDLTPDVRNSLDMRLANLNTRETYLADHEAKLADVDACSSTQCAEVVQDLYQQGDWTGESAELNALSEILTSLEKA
ncbi:MAG: hypothetical protein AAFX90_01140 [Pseudomonadota bacterium]